jgi:hypothetical protein
MAAKKAKQIKSISDLTPDASNVNKGTERGHFQLDWSITENGAGRSILADADGVVIAGNKTLEVAADHQLPVRVIESDGTELIVVQRTDLRLRGKGKEATRARSLAIADNRVSEVNYEADITQLLEHQAAGIDLTPMYRQGELDAMIAGLTPPELEEGEKSERGAKPEDTTEDYADRTIKRVTLFFGLTEYDDFLQRLNVVCQKEEIDNHTDAVVFLLKQYENT